jgi:hypothetical protein
MYSPADADNIMKAVEAKKWMMGMRDLGDQPWTNRENW